MLKRIFLQFPAFPLFLLILSVGGCGGDKDYTTWNLPDGAIARLGKGWIKDVKFSPNGNLIAVATSIGIWLYDAHTYAEIALLTGHTETVNSVAFSQDGKTLASASWDDTVKLWDIETKKEIATLTGYTHLVESVAFSED